MSETLFIIGEDKKTLTVERTYNAPKSLVWKAYSTKEMLLKWWGPRGWDTIIKRLEFKNGGTWHYGMKCVDESMGEWFGMTSWGMFTFQNIHPEDLFEYVDVFCDEDANINPDFPSSHSVIEFSEQDGKTTVKTITTYAREEDLTQVIEMGMKEGLTQTLDKLEEVLRG